MRPEGVRPPALLIVLLLLPLAGCLEQQAAHLEGRLDEARRERDEARWHAANATAEARVARDAAQAAANDTRALASARDDALARQNGTAASLAEREARLAQTQAEVERAGSEIARLAGELEGARKVTSDDRTLQDILGELKEAEERAMRAQTLYVEALEGRFQAMTTIDRANVTWQFVDLRGDIHQWTYPIEDYRQDVKRPRPDTYLYMETQGGRSLRVPDPRPYVDAEPFLPVIADITDGRSEQDFVREVFRLKSQLVDYQFALVDERGFYKYPGETLVEGTGICGDTTILLESLLRAGKEQAGYTFETYLWVVQWDLAAGRFVENAETVNHGLIEVRFADGTSWYVETTSFDFVLHPKVHGWSFAWE